MGSTAHADDCTPPLERPYFVTHTPSPPFGAAVVRDLVAEDGVLKLDVDLPPQAVYLRIAWGDADLWLRPSQREVCVPEHINATAKATVMAVNLAGDASALVEHRVRILSLHRGHGWGLIRMLVMSPIVGALALVMWWLIRRHRRSMPQPEDPVPKATLARRR
jgi:hypothetical protein